MSKRRIVAVPAETLGGIAAERSHHFGHAPFFSIVELDGDRVTGSRSIEHPPHVEGGCGLTVGLLASEGVTDVVAWGMGRGPQSKLPAAGISTWRESSGQRVEDAIAALVAGNVERFDADHTCMGHSDR